MTASSADARQNLVATLTELFRQRGYEAVSIGDIAHATGLGRSSLYHHFPGGKEAMAEAVIAFTRAALDAHVLAPLQSGRAPSARIEAMLDAVAKLYASGEVPCVLAALLSTAEEGPLAWGASKILADWTDALAATVTDLGVPVDDARRRARAGLALVQGALVMTRALKDPQAFHDAMDVARRTLVQPHAPSAAP